MNKKWLFKQRLPNLLSQVVFWSEQPAANFYVSLLTLWPCIAYYIMLTQSEMKYFWIGGAIYEKCYQDKGCFGTPDNCVAKRNCDMLGKQLF